jgi:hypothetical protein
MLVHQSKRISGEPGWQAAISLSQRQLTAESVV